MPLPHTSREICSQFAVDAPRLQIAFDGQVTTDPPAVILCEILNRYPNGLLMAHWCTQTALADIYIRKLEQIQAVAPTVLSHLTTVLGSEPSDRDAITPLHLVDGGKQTNDFEAHSLTIVKPFVLCRITADDGFQRIRAMMLRVQVSDDGSYTVSWKVQPHRPSQSSADVPHSKEEEEDDFEIIDHHDCENDNVDRSAEDDASSDPIYLRVMAVIGVAFALL